MNEKLLKVKELLSSLLVEDEAHEMTFGSIATEAGILYWEGDEDLKVEDKVFVADENGENKTEAEDGDYKIEDGTIYRVKDGKVAEIVEPEVEDPEPAPAPEPETEETETALSKFQAEIQKYEESYQDKEQKIREAIARTGAVDFWVAEAGDEYAVVDMWDPATESSKYFKYTIAWGEDGEATATLEGEVVSAFVPVEVKEEISDPEPEAPVAEETNMEDEPEPEAKEPEDKEPEVEERDLAKELDDLKALVEAIQKKLESIEGEKPATPQEEFEVITDDSKLSMLERYGKALRK